MKRSVGVLISFLLGVFVIGAVPAAAIGGDPGPGCAVDWTAAPKDTTVEAFSAIVGARAGQQECFDRFVVDMAGDAPRLLVQYVDEFRSAGAGFLIPLSGGARLLVQVFSPAYDTDLLDPTYAPPNPSEAVDVAGFRTFRQIAFDGTYEGESAFGIGVRERLPFRAFTLAGPGAGSRLVVDVAHAWTGSSAPQGASPIGNFESVSGVSGGVQVKGWMLDPDSLDPIYAWVTVDGAGRHVYANVNRPDVGAAFPGYGPNHGFFGVVPAGPGVHRVCVTASNVGPGEHTSLGCRNVSVPNPSPFGNFERATGVAGGVEVAGWMADPSSPMTSLYAWVTVDGAGRHLYANVNRPDVGAAFPGYGPNHGFLGTVPAGPGAHRVCVTAANIGPGSHTSLGCRNVSVPDPSPFGNYESARGTVDGVEVKGWMADPSVPTSPIYAWVTIDGVGRHVYANQNRPDVGAAYPGYGPDHGFRATIAAAPGSHRVCVTASNVGPGNHTPLGCRTVGVFAQPAVWPAAHLVFATPEAAAADFVTQALGVPANLSEFRQGDTRSGEIDVLWSDGGPTVVEGTLAMRQLAPDDGWFVLAGTSAGVDITTPSALAEVPAGPVTVEGIGRGYEGTIHVQAFRAGSTTLLDSTFTTAGASSTPQPFSVTLDLSDAQPGDVVAIVARGDVGVADDPGELSAIPIVIVP